MRVIATYKAQTECYHLRQRKQSCRSSTSLLWPRRNYRVQLTANLVI